ncbi:NrfD/PsrC family molybdoenzyme membrane anchor subunit [Chloroflexota bacterium]
MSAVKKSSLSLTLLFLAVLVAVGAGLGIVRLVNGLGMTTGLSDAYPWGLWIVYDIFFVPFSAGAFMILAITHIYGKKEYHGIARPVVVAGFLGEVMVLLVLVMDLGRWHQFYNVLLPWYWNPRSFMFQVSICLTIYMGIMVLEIAPAILERLNWQKPLRLIAAATVLIAGMGIVLSSLHQSSLGSLFLLMPYKLHPLWWTPLLPLLFFTSAVFAGLAMVIFVVALSFRVFQRPLDLELLSQLARVVAVLLGVYLVLKLGDLLLAGEIGLIFSSGWLGWLYLVEIGAGVVLPMVLFSMKKVRSSSSGLIWGSACVLGGVALNRVNVALLAYGAPAGATYFPHWIEILISVAAVAAGILLFVLAVRFLPILPKAKGTESLTVPHWSRRALVFVGGALTLLTITVVLLVQPITQAVATKTGEAEQAGAAVSPREGECQTCHQDEQALADAGAAPDQIALLTIDPLPAEEVHGRLRCVTCHYGDRDTVEMEAAHAGTLTDPTGGDAAFCVACHQDLPAEFPQDRLRTPHDAVTHGEMAGVACSDCHGAVGHGFDPVSGEIICPMGVCLDCHQERNLDSELSDCSACHIGPHEPVPAYECNVCHQSTGTWQSVGMAEHPVELAGGHAGAECASCHADGKFGQEISTDCAGCHEPPDGTHYGPVCEDCHTPAGFQDARLPDHPAPLEGKHASAPCAGCHAGDQPAPEHACESCHDRPEDHLPGDCTLCHTPQGWVGSISWLVSLTPPVSHELEGQSCLACHALETGMKPAPVNHGQYVDAQCVLCHK